MTTDNYRVTVPESSAGARLDKFLATELPELSRSRIQTLLEQGHITCNGNPVSNASGKVKTDQIYEVTIPEAAPSHMVAQDIDLDIIYEDDDMLVINKQPGLTVHPGAGNPDMTLVNALLAYCGDTLSGIGGVVRPGIVHRIDKDTSGLLVVAKHDTAHIALSAQLADRSLKRVYNAIIWGLPKAQSGTVTGNIGRSMSNRQKMTIVKSGGKPAVTHYKLLEDLGVVSLLQCNLETGRTHQIRVHLTSLGHPLVGDQTYGISTAQRLNNGIYKKLPDNTRAALLAFPRQALHAKELTLIHPRTEKEMHFECALPEDMQRLLKSL